MTAKFAFGIDGYAAMLDLVKLFGNMSDNVGYRQGLRFKPGAGSANGFFERGKFAAKIKPDMVTEAIAIVRLDGRNGANGSIRFLCKLRIVRIRIINGHRVIGSL